jgi:hypothetical protein
MRTISRFSARPCRNRGQAIERGRSARRGRKRLPRGAHSASQSLDQGANMRRTGLLGLDALRRVRLQRDFGVLLRHIPAENEQCRKRECCDPPIAGAVGAVSRSNGLDVFADRTSAACHPRLVEYLARTLPQGHAARRAMVALPCLDTNSKGQFARRHDLSAIDTRRRQERRRVFCCLRRIWVRAPNSSVYCPLTSGKARTSDSDNCTFNPGDALILSAVIVTSFVPMPRLRPMSTWMD